MVIDGDETEASYHLTIPCDDSYLLIVNVVGGPLDPNAITVTLEELTLSLYGIVWTHESEDNVIGLLVEAAALGFDDVSQIIAYYHYIEDTNVAVVTLTMEQETVLTVTFDAQGGTWPEGTFAELPPMFAVVLGREYGANFASPPERYGFTFDGWFTAATGGVEVTSETIVTNEESHTLFAQWSAIEGIEVTLDVRGGTLAAGTTSPFTVTFDQEYGENLAQAPTRSGFVFIGWFAEGTGGTQVIASTRVATTESHTLHARWQQQNIVFDTGGGAPPEIIFRDPEVPLTPPPETHISYISGFPDGTVRPNNFITRAEVSMILFRLIGSEDRYAQQHNHFSDVQDSAWYAQAVNYLANRGILHGYEDGTFRPNANMSRAELTAVMSRLLEIRTNVINNFTDVNSGHWAYRYINNASSRGWIIGYEDNSFRPDNQITRAETVTVVNRVMDRIPNPSTINYHLAGALIFSDLTQAHWAFYQIMEAAIEHEFHRNEQGSEIWTAIIRPR
jgi:uncharacterized repeat protein (TIGR02543 family)